MSDPERDVVVDAQRIASFGTADDVEYFAEPGSSEAKLYHQRRMLRAAAEVLEIGHAEALENCAEVEGGHLYVWRADRSGAVFIDGLTQQHLYAPSHIDFSEHLASFQAGIRS